MSFCIVFLVALLPLGTNTETQHLKYYKDATFECDEVSANISAASPISKKYWLFPNGDVHESVDSTTKHIEIYSSNSTLKIIRIDDIDFGKYYCILVHDDHTISRIEHGLNIDGAYFGDLLKEYKHRAVVGGVAAGILFAIVGSFCAFWTVRYRTRDRRNKAVDELDKAIDGFDLTAYDNVAIEPDTKVEKESVIDTSVSKKLEANADGVTDYDQKM